MGSRTIIPIILFLAGISVFSQEAPIPLPLQCALPYYECVDYDKNRIIFPEEKDKMTDFYRKLDTLALFGNKRINIVHIGGSHVQADIFSNRIRQNMSKILPDIAAQRGFIFPFSAAKTNNPQNYTVSYTGKWEKRQNSLPPFTENIGIAGYSISTNCKDASVSFNLNSDSTEWQYNRLILLAAISDPTWQPLLVVGTDTVAALQIEEGYVFNLNNLVDSGTIIIRQRTDLGLMSNDSLPLLCNRYKVEDCGNKEFFTIFGLLPENDFYGITYHALGVNGASLKSWLKCGNFAKEIKLLKPDMVILGVGINDANIPYGSFKPETFKREYQQLLQMIYNVSPDCAVIFITNNDSVLRKGKYSYGINRNGALVRRAMTELAAEENGGVWDLYSIMGEAGSIAVWEENGLAKKDRVHFTFPGYELLGDLFFNALIYDWLYNR